MTRLRLLVGLAFGTTAVTLVTLGARRTRRRLVPGWSGPEAILADILLVVSVVTIVTDLLGAFGLFRALPLAVGITLAAALLWCWGSPATPETSRNSDTNSDLQELHPDHAIDLTPHRWPAYAAGAGVATVAALWSSSLPFTYRRGIYDWDSLWYHLPMAANFVRTGDFIPMRLYDADAIVSTYPSGAEVYHALAMVIAGSDLLSPILNLCWAGLFLLAMHVFGRRFGTAHLSTIVGSIILAMPMVVQLEASSVLSEMMALACLASAIALFVAGPGRNEEVATNRHARGFYALHVAPGQALLVGLAIGLVASTKLAMLVPAIVVFLGLTTALLLQGKAKSLRIILPVTIGAIATGSFWYVRDLIVFNSPVPSLHLSIGRIGFPSITPDGEFSTMLPTILKGLQTGTSTAEMTQTFGPFWFIFLLLIPLGTIIVALRHRKHTLLNVLTIVGATVCLVGFYTPQYSLAGVYLNLFANGRYLLAGILLSSLAAIAFISSDPKAHRWALGLSLAVLVATSLAYLLRPRRNVWLGAYPIHAPWATIAIFVGITTAFVWAMMTAPTKRRDVTRLVSLGGATMVIGMLIAAQPRYLTDRYQIGPTRWEVYDWAQAHSDRTIGVEPFDYADFSRLRQSDLGWMQRRYSLLIGYPLYGDSWTNKVEPVATFDGDRVARPTSCSEWWATLARIHATEVLVWDSGRHQQTSNYLQWTKGSPTSRFVASQSVGRQPGGRLILYTVDTSHPPC